MNLYTPDFNSLMRRLSEEVGGRLPVSLDISVVYRGKRGRGIRIYPYQFQSGVVAEVSSLGLRWVCSPRSGTGRVKMSSRLRPGAPYLFIHDLVIGNYRCIEDC